MLEVVLVSAGMSNSVLTVPSLCIDNVFLKGVLAIVIVTVTVLPT